MKTKRRLSILNILYIIASIKQYGLTHTIKTFIVYNFINFVLRIILNSIRKVNRETTLIGVIVKYIIYFYDNYGHKAYMIYYYGIVVTTRILSIINRTCVPTFLLSMFGFPEVLTPWCIITFITFLIYRVVTDFIKIYGK